MFIGYLRRLAMLTLGLLLSAVGIVFMLQANIGLEPWSVLQQGMSGALHITYGQASAIVGVAAILAAVLFGERIGFGTILNIVLCAFFIDVMLAIGFVQTMNGLAAGVAMLAVGLELLALGTWLYMKSALGTGPRDALMVALARKTGRSVGICRITVELLVILCGWMLGGRVGIGTVISAIGLGWLFNLNFRLLHFPAAQVHQESMSETVGILLQGLKAKRAEN